MALSKNKNLEMDRLYQRWYLYYEYMINTYGNENIFSKTKKLIDEAFEKRNLVQLRAANKDINTMFKEMPYKDMNILLKLFKEKLGEDISIIEQKNIQKINSILKRGKIKTPQEYELVMNRVEVTYSDKTKEQEIMELNKLLILFHEKQNY